MTQHKDEGLNNGLVRETRVIRKYSAFEMLEFWETFKQEMKETHCVACETVGHGSGWDQSNHYGGMKAA